MIDLLNLRRGPLRAIEHTYYPLGRYHVYRTPGGALVEVERGSGRVEINTRTGERITMEPCDGIPFRLADVLRVLGALQVIAPLTGGVRIVA